MDNNFLIKKYTEFFGVVVQGAFESKSLSELLDLNNLRHISTKISCSFDTYLHSKKKELFIKLPNSYLYLKLCVSEKDLSEISKLQITKSKPSSLRRTYLIL